MPRVLPQFLRSPLGLTPGAGMGAGPALASYAAREARQYTLREVTVPVLPAGRQALRVLHLSDIHMAPDQRAKQQWLRSLADPAPDTVIDTGDNLAHMRSVPVVVDSLGPLLDVPGVSVFGSNDYYSPGFRNPLRYLLPRLRPAQHPHPCSCRGASSSSASPTVAGCTCATRSAGSPSTARPSRWPASTTPTCATTTSRPSPGPPTRTPTCGWGSPMRRTCGCSTSTPRTATTPSSPATPTAAGSACRASVR
ncbi:metallophosphoesterase [Nocardioides sp. B-3]|uniref:metallophosphoesterase n=1 Tax=Nocardioides sp. B-3 TaxID=2895565 RepID=UPI002152434C|nr:metallophosphoesterase [Nocardioides sp. B-3]UUZ60887.1 hypothetical protein LP418_09280 [Nocardioides sp. B-3]